MSLDFSFSLDELEAAEASTANPYLSDPARGLQLVARLVSQPQPDAVHDQQRALLARLHELIHVRFIELTAQGSYPGEAQALRELLALERSLDNLALFPYLARKTIVGVGGGFSAGKSRFLNTLLGIDWLPESLEPTTAIPSFVTRGDSDRIVALNRFNHQVGLDRDALQAITHAFNQHYRVSLGEGFGFAHILKLLMLHSGALRWQNLAFLDTPGYSKADTQNAMQTDQGIALQQLSEADHVLWLLSAKNGSIRQDDLAFLRQLNHPKPVFFVVTQADLVGKSRIAAILDSTRDAVKQAGLSCAGLMAWSAPLGAETGARMAGDHINTWLHALERETKRTQYGRQCANIIDGYISHNRSNANDSRDRISALNHVQLVAQELPAVERATLQEMLKEHRAGQAVFNQQIDAFTSLKKDLLDVVISIAQSFAEEEPSSDELYQQGRRHYDELDYEEAVDCFRKAAEQGHADAQYDLAECFYLGFGVTENNEAAVIWYRKAAEQGHVEAQHDLAACFYYGVGVVESEDSAVTWYQKAAEQGHVKAQFQLARCYYAGRGIEKNDSIAAIWYRKAAEKGHADAQFWLGYCYEKGMGVPKNEGEAVTWYRKAAEQGDEAAQCNLGVCYEYGKGVPKNESMAVAWYRKAAERGNAVAQCNLGVCYAYGTGVSKNEGEAVSWYRKAADKGNDRAQFRLGFCYEYGTGVSKNDGEAVSWYRKAAEQGYAAAQCNLGVCYEYGTGVSKNDGEAVSWYRKAAEQGYAAAQRNLGVCYEKGKGVPKSEAEAVFWYRKAADQGHAHAQSSLGECYYWGRGVSENKEWAVAWYRKAAEQGHAYAQYSLAFCYYHGHGVARDKATAGVWYRKSAAQGNSASIETLKQYF